MKPLRPYLLVATAVVLAVLMTRTLGYGIDEVNYVACSFTNGMCDSRGSGKPPLFYQLNFLISNTLGRVLFFWRPVSLYLGYAIFNALSIAWATIQLPVATPRRWLFLALLLLSPIFLLNSTQVMMETPIFGLLAVLFGGLVRAEKDAPIPRVALVSAVVAILIKETAFPAVVILCLGFLPRLKNRGLPLVKAIAIAVVIRYVSYKLMRIHMNPVYGMPENIFAWSKVMPRLSELGDYLMTWLFLILPAGLALAVGVGIGSAVKRSPYPWHLLVMVGLSAISVAGILVASEALYIRYTYPGIWVGTLVVAALVACRCSIPMGWLVVGFSLVPVINMWYPARDRLSWWPTTISGESYNQGTVILAGVPAIGWYLTSGFRKGPFRVWNPSNDEVIAKYFKNLDRRSEILVEESEFEGASHSRVIALKDYSFRLLDCAVPACGLGQYSLAICNTTRMDRWAKPNSEMVSWTCLP